MTNLFTKKTYFFLFMFFLINLLLIIFFPSESGDTNTIKIVAKNILYNYCISLSNPLNAECIPHWGSNQGPGYPFLVSISLYLFGENLNPVRFFQMTIHLGVLIYFIFKLQKLLNIKINNFFILIIIFSPLTFGWHRYVLTESISFSLTIFLLTNLLPIFFNKKVNFVLIGIIVSIGFFIRYDFIFYILPICLLLFITQNFKSFLISSLKISIISILIVSPYLYRNFQTGLDFLPPTQIGLHLEDGPKTPNGYVDWISTWSFTNYMYANALYPVDYGNYDNIIIHEKAYFNDAQVKLVEEDLKKLSNYNNLAIPKEIDNNFKEIAEYNRNNFKKYVYFELPVKRFFSLWFNPVTSLGFPGSFNNNRIDLNYFTNLNSIEKLSFVIENSYGLFFKLANFIYRFLIIIFFGYVIVKIFKNNIKKLKPILYFVSSFLLLKNFFLIFTFYTATRHIISSVIFIEILLILFFFKKNST